MSDRMSDDVTFRPAWPDEHTKILRMFRIPPPSRTGVQWLVATTGSVRERLLGVALILKPVAGDTAKDNPASLLLWRVLPAYNGSTTEHALIEHAIKTASAGGCKKLSSFAALPVGEDAHQALIKHGFSVSEQIDEFEAPFAAVWQRCQRTYKLLDRRQVIPENAEISSFAPHLLPEIRSVFHNAGIVGCLEFDARMSAHHEEPMDLERSTSIVIDGQLIGAMMVCPARSVPLYHVPGRWVAEGHRNSWVNAVLIYNSVRQGVSMDLDSVRFVAHRGVHKETAVLADKLQGKQVRSLQRLTLDMTD